VVIVCALCLRFHGARSNSKNLCGRTAQTRFLTDVKDEVVPARVRETENEAKPGWTHTFPRGSVTVIALRRKC
jgi:hypothetical protein